MYGKTYESTVILNWWVMTQVEYKIANWVSYVVEALPNQLSVFLTGFQLVDHKKITPLHIFTIPITIFNL